MANARKFGYFKPYTPNSQFDRRNSRKTFERGKSLAERDPKETRAGKRELRELEQMKKEAYHGV